MNAITPFPLARRRRWTPPVEGALVLPPAQATAAADRARADEAWRAAGLFDAAAAAWQAALYTLGTERDRLNRAGEAAWCAACAARVGR